MHCVIGFKTTKMGKRGELLTPTKNDSAFSRWRHLRRRNKNDTVFNRWRHLRRRTLSMIISLSPHAAAVALPWVGLYHRPPTPPSPLWLQAWYSTPYYTVYFTIYLEDDGSTAPTATAALIAGMVGVDLLYPVLAGGAAGGVGRLELDLDALHVGAEALTRLVSQHHHLAPMHRSCF